jgi:hypothetical protein
VQPSRTKKRKKKTLVPNMVGSYFTFNVACMQIVRFNINRRPKTNISCFLFIVKVKHV